MRKAAAMGTQTSSVTAPLGALWAAYVVMLLPVAGVVQLGQQAAADRYMYLPLLVPAIGVADAALRAV